MRRLLIFCLFLLLCTTGAFAQTTPVPSLMNFQGRLARPDGTPVADGTYSIRFALYNVPSGGTDLWSQTVSNVTVRNGAFAALLSGVPGPIFNGNLYLEIQIGSDPPLTPRQPLVSVAYAMKANTVPDGAINNSSIADGTITGAKIANGTITAEKLDTNALNPLAWLLSGNAGTTFANFLGTTDNQSLIFKTNNTERMRILNTGAVGINYSGPSHTLTVQSADDNTLRLIGPGGAGSGSRLNIGDGDYIYLYEDTDDSLTFHVEERLAITGGNVGIGTTSPQTKLEVSGRVRMTEFQLGTSATAGRVLTTDTNGVGTWQVVNISGVAAGGALTGTYPNPSLQSNSVATGNIVDSTILTQDISDGAITSAKISDGTIQSSDIANGTIGTVDISDGAITGAKILDGTIAAADIASSAVTSVKLASEAASLNKVSGGVLSVSSTKIGINTTSPTHVLTVSSTTSDNSLRLIGSGDFGKYGKMNFGDDDYVYLQEDDDDYLTIYAANRTAILGGNVGINTSSPSYRFYVNGQAGGSTTWSQSSDARLKKNVQTFESALNRILNLRGVTFEWDRAAYPEMDFAYGRQIGFIAQEVEKILPEVVTTDKKGFKSVGYANVVPVLVEAIKTLKADVDSRQKKLDEQQRDLWKIKEENNALRAAIEALNARMAALEQQKEGGK